MASSERVEAVPADPQDQSAQGGDGHVVTRDGLGTAINKLADAGAKQHGAHQTSPSTNGVNDGGASEIDETELAQPTTVPLPGTGDGVDAVSYTHLRAHET